MKTSSCSTVYSTQASLDRLQKILNITCFSKQFRSSSDCPYEQSELLLHCFPGLSKNVHKNLLTDIKWYSFSFMASFWMLPGPKVTKLCSNLRLRLKHADWLILSICSGSANQLVLSLSLRLIESFVTSGPELLLLFS